MNLKTEYYFKVLILPKFIYRVNTTLVKIKQIFKKIWSNLFCSLYAIQKIEKSQKNVSGGRNTP